nr:hypothetical protein [uncultured Chryseobacterium sp.]
MRPTFILLILAVLFSNFKAQLNASNFKLGLDRENNQIHYAFNLEGTYFKIEATVYKNSISPSNIIAYTTKEDDSDYQPINYPPGYIFTSWSYKYDDASYEAASQYILVLNAWDVAGNPVSTSATLTYTIPTITASDLVMYLDKVNKKIHYSFKFEGTYFKVDTKVYRNTISPSTLVASGSREDDSEYQPINYPPGNVFASWSYNYNDSAYPDGSNMYILIIKAWEKSGIPIYVTKTLSVEKTIPGTSNPNPTATNLKIDGFVITEPFNNNKIIFDSYHANQYPSPTKLVQSTKTYNFKVTVRKEGTAALNNVNLTFLQYDQSWGTYPNTSPASPQNKQINFGTNDNLKSVDFLSNIINFNGSQLITLGLAFHVDKNSAVAETNESDNYRVIHVQGYPAGTVLKSANFGETEALISVDVLDEKGKHIKTLTTSENDTDLLNVKKQLEPGNYYFKTNRSTKRVKIENR